MVPPQRLICRVARADFCQAVTPKCVRRIGQTDRNSERTVRVQLSIIKRLYRHGMDNLQGLRGADDIGTIDSFIYPVLLRRQPTRMLDPYRVTPRGTFDMDKRAHAQAMKLQIVFYEAIG